MQVIEDITRKMVTGELPPGEKLPSVRDLALAYAINPNTASRVYREMEQMELSFTRRGLGTFITEDREVYDEIRAKMVRECLSTFVRGMHTLGYTDTDEMAALLRDYKEKTEAGADSDTSKEEE